MSSNKVPAVRHQSSETKPVPKIRVIFWVAVAIRKLQRFESDRFKNSLEYNFNKQAAIEELRQLYADDEDFFVEEFVKLSYFIRKFCFTFEDLNSIESRDPGNRSFIRAICKRVEYGCKDEVAANQKRLYFLCLSLKYLTQNSSSESSVILSISSIAELIEQCKCSLVVTELVALLANLIEKSNIVLSKDQCTQLENLVLSLFEISPEAKAVFFSKLEGNRAIKHSATGADQANDDPSERKSMEIRNVKRNQQMVTKTIQTVKSKQETKKSEETDFKLLNLSDCMKNRNRKINSVLETVPTENDSGGDDRSMWRSTWSEVINLFAVSERGNLKTDDRDNYLPSKFLGDHYYVDTFLRGHGAKIMYSFFINRMCAAMLSKASQKQKLNDAAIEKLFKCVTSFDNLVRVLELGSNYVDMFVSKVLLRYWDLKKVDSPNIVDDFIKKIMEKTTEEYEVGIWRFKTTKVRPKSFSRQEIEKIVVAEINKVRCDAVKALYKSALRDKAILTEGRVKTIRACLTKETDRLNDSEFRNHIFHLLEIAESLQHFEYAAVFRDYIGQVNKESVADMESILRFLNNQAKDMQRCRELFDEKVIRKLIDCLGSESVFGVELKKNVMKIINSYLQNELTKPLSHGNLELLLSSSFESNHSDLISCVLTSLLLIADKDGQLPQSVLHKLVTKLNLELPNLREDHSNYVLFILSRAICGERSPAECFLRNSDDIERISYKLQCDLMVDLNDDVSEDGHRVKFEKPSDRNRHNSSNQISLLTAKIILKSTENKVALSSVAIDNLLLTLHGSNDDDKQTKIVSSKCLYYASRNGPFESSHLSQMLDFMDSEVYDVWVYIQLAYLNGCVKVASASDQPLDPIHLEHVSSLYAHESLQLGVHDYESEINKNLFKTLLHEASKQEFKDKNLFLLFSGIVNSNEKYTTEILEILLIYTGEYAVPDITVRTLETVLNFSEHLQRALLVIENLIVRGASLFTSKTLNIFIDNLYMSINSRLRFHSFKLLEKVSRCQEMDEDIFWKFEMAKAGFALGHQRAILQNPTDKQFIIKFIQTKTERGMQLPIDTTLALEKEISHRGVLKVFANLSKNRQIIQNNLLESLIDMFDPMKEDADDDNVLLISIFENAAKNNQTLPRKLYDKLEEALNRKRLQEKVLPVFIFLAQKGEKLSRHINDMLLDQLTIETDLVLKQELLSSLGSLINANQKEITVYGMKINQILINEMKSDNFNIQKLCIKVVAKFASITNQLDEELLEELIRVGTNADTNKTIRSEIVLLFDSHERNSSFNEKCYRQKLELANLSCESNKDLLSRLSDFFNLEDGFLEQNYKQLKEIIDHEDPKLQHDALNILLKSKCKSNVTDELLESVAILYESTMTDSLKSSCLDLFKSVASSGKILKGRAYNIWAEKMNREENITKFFQSQVCIELRQHFHLNNEIITDMLELTESSEKIFNLHSLAELIELTVEKNSLCFMNEPFVRMIEQCLLEKRIIETALPSYCLVIKLKKFYRAEDCLSALARYFYEHLKDTYVPVNLLAQLVEAMYFASESVRLPDDCVKLLEDNLDHCDERVRGYSFRTLRIISKDAKYVKSSKFDNWCDQLLENLAQKAKVNLIMSTDCWDLLEIITSIRFLDIAVFKNSGNGTWKRELLLSSLFQSYTVYQLDQILFYRSWFLVEETFRYEDSCRILDMIQMSKFDSFPQIAELISIMPEMAFDEIVRQLSIHRPTPYRAFKQEWCMRKLKEHFPIRDDVNVRYLKKLVEKFCTGYHVNFIAKIILSIESIDNLRAFEDLIEFCERERIELDDVEIEKVKLRDLKHLMEAKHLCRQIKCRPQNEAEAGDLMKIIRTLLNAGWNFAQLRELIQSFKLQKNCYLIHILSTIHKYNILSSSSNFGKCKQILTETSTFTESIKKFNKLAIENHFQLEGKEKDLSELLDELLDRNLNGSLVDDVARNSLDIREHIFNKHALERAWHENQIKSWAENMKAKASKGNTTAFTDYKAIAIILRANFLVTGHTLTDPQILCSLIALRRDENLKGKLLQVATGEGKSTIVCILAIINALRGRQVDVITSSPVLAERDAKQKAKLFRMFNLTCSDNSDKTVYLKGAKNCYKADIVYGEVSQFQFDILRDNYSKLGTLGGRKCTTAIVDEVDSMLIDDSSKIARLSSTVAGLDHFQAIYVFIWQRLISIKEKFIMFNNKMYFIYGKVELENGKFTLEISDDSDDSNIVKIPDLESYVYENGVSGVGEVVGDDLDDYLRKSLGNYLDSQIKANQIYIPSNFSEFFEKQKSKWIFNAIEALNYQENVHYVVQEGQIKPVDYYSTGIVQSSTNWSDGLHQFLQLKHNLKMTSETLTTNFLSNAGFINKYEQVYGLTGTLGSETARDVLRNIYNVQLINVPQRRQKQFFELEPVIVQGEANWLREIVSTVTLEVEKERGILIICETIEHANQISVMLKHKLRPSAVKLYTMNDMNQEKSVERILPGEVIIATNLAGRGTDIQTQEIESSGGLHVILTFLPSNQRVEDQAFGRTARQGKRGTGLMILNASNLVGCMSTTTKTTKAQRDLMESVQLRDFEKMELKLIQLKDKLFYDFCKFVNDIRDKIRAKHNSYTTKVVSKFTVVLPTVHESNMLAAVEEQWAMFLRRIDDGDIKCEDAETLFKELMDKLREDFANDTLIKNPYYYTCIANDILVNEWSLRDASKAAKALGYFRKATELEKARNREERSPQVTLDMTKVTTDESDLAHGCGAAHYGTAWCLILLKEANYKDTALASLKGALQCLSDEMSVLNTMQILLQQKQADFVNSDLYKQLNLKATILGSYLNSIQGSIEAIKRSKRLMDLVATQRHEKGDTILETTKHFSEQERNETKRTEFKSKDVELNSNETYSLAFNSLTTSDDSWIPFTNGTRDQAVQTLHHAFDPSFERTDKGVLSKLTSARKHIVAKACGLDVNSYSDVRIKLKQVDLARIKRTLFSPDKEFQDLTREAAIEKLKAIVGTRSLRTNLRISSIDEPSVNEQHNDKEMNEVIRIIEDHPISDTNLRFDILIKKSNENKINKIFAPHSHLRSSLELTVEFNNLSKNDVKNRLSTIKAKTVDIEFVLNKLYLSKLICENESLQCGKVFISEQNVFEKVGRDELLKRVSQLKTDDSPYFVKFETFQLGEARKIVEQCHEDVLFGISFNDVYDYYGSGLDDGQVNFSFAKLNREKAEMIIEVIRQENFEFSLEFSNLSDKQVRFILKNADLTQEEMEIRKVKNLSDAYLKDNIPSLELAEFAAKGIERVIEISEKQFIPWRSVVAVAVLGSVQVIIGGVLIATGFGSNVGMGFVTEGLADMFTAYRAYSNRQFHWSDYCKQKAISLVISAVSAGYTKCKKSIQDAAKGVEALATGVGKEALEQAGTQVLYNTKAVGQTMIKTGKNLKSLAFKYVGVKAGEAVVREGLNIGIQQLSNLSFDLLKPRICESIQSRVRSSFCGSELVGLLRKMYAIDLTTGSNELQSRVEQIVADTINPRHDFVRQQWDSVALPLLKGILSESSRFGSNASMAIRIIGTLNGLYQVQGLIENVVKELIAKLRLVDRNSMTMSLVLHRSLAINRDNAIRIVNKMKMVKIFDETDNFDISQSKIGENCEELQIRIKAFADDWHRNRAAILKELNVTSNSLEDDVGRGIQFVQSFYTHFIKIEFDSFDPIIKSLSDLVADQLIRIVDSQLIQPWSSLAVSSLTDQLSKKLQHSYLVDKEQNSDSHNADQKKFEELENKKELTLEEEAFIKNYGKFRTFTEQINYNAKDHCIAYSQCEIAYYAGKENRSSGSSDKAVKEAADGVRNGESANLGVMITTAKINGINLKVVDDANYVRTQEDIDAGVEVVYIKRGENNEIGHAYYMDREGIFVDPNSTDRDCFFAAFSKILESRGITKSVADLRQEVSRKIESNSNNYCKVLDAENWIRDRHPYASNDLLFAVGATKNITGPVKNGDIKVRLSPSIIRYLQDSIRGTFCDGTGLSDTLSQILEGKISVESLEPIEVVFYEGWYRALTGHRRLYLYKLLEERGIISDIPVIVRSLEQPNILELFNKRNTTKIDGMSINVRGNGVSEIETVANKYGLKQPQEVSLAVATPTAASSPVGNVGSLMLARVFLAPATTTAALALVRNCCAETVKRGGSLAVATPTSALAPVGNGGSQMLAGLQTAGRYSRDGAILVARLVRSIAPTLPRVLPQIFELCWRLFA